jgi:hypothetical protein
VQLDAIEKLKRPTPSIDMVIESVNLKTYKKGKRGV